MQPLGSRYPGHSGVTEAASLERSGSRGYRTHQARSKAPPAAYKAAAPPRRGPTSSRIKLPRKTFDARIEAVGRPLISTARRPKRCGLPQVDSAANPCHCRKVRPWQGEPHRWKRHHCLPSMNRAPGFPFWSRGLAGKATTLFLAGTGYNLRFGKFTGPSLPAATGSSRPGGPRTASSLRSPQFTESSLPRRYELVGLPFSTAFRFVMTIPSGSR